MRPIEKAAIEFLVALALGFILFGWLALVWTVTQ